MFREMGCEHKSYGDVVWLPCEYRGRSIGLKPHPYCAECGLVKNISSDRSKPLGHYLNILGYLGQSYNLAQVQVRLISKELEGFDDNYGFSKSQQDEVFLKAVLKYTRIPERYITDAL